MLKTTGNNMTPDWYLALILISVSHLNVIKKMKVFVLPVVVKSRKSILSKCIKATLLVNVLRPARRRMWSSGCMELTGENTIACPCAILYIRPSLAMARSRTRLSAVRSRQLTARAVTRPLKSQINLNYAWRSSFTVCSEDQTKKHRKSVCGQSVYRICWC